MENSQPLPVRALLAALGFDPDTHRGYRRISPFKGFQVVDWTDPAKPFRVRFYTHRQLVHLQRDAWFTGEITRELEREIKAAEEKNAPAEVSAE